MYYYIIDPPNSAQTPKIAQRLQELITPLGISGEIGIASPARSAEELTYMGVDKGYTTFVAVGGEDLVTTIASIVINESRERIAIGIIPIDAGRIVPQLIGVANNDMRGAVEVIKQRHLDLIDLVHISPKKYLITEAEIIPSRKIKMSLDIDQNLKAELEADYVHISNDLVMTLHTQKQQSGWFKSILGGKERTEQLTSQFHGKQIRFTAHEPLPIMVGGHVVAKTPTTFTKVPAALKLITARATLLPKTITDLPRQQPEETKNTNAL
jgi:diacylglycerol kinase family enzyme